MHMYFTYILASLKNATLYVGSTNDLKRRLQEHNDGAGGVYTSKLRPFVLVHYEAYVSEKDAKKQERFYKTGYGREVLREKVVDSLAIALSSNGRTADSESAYRGSNPCEAAQTVKQTQVTSSVAYLRDSAFSSILYCEYSDR